MTVALKKLNTYLNNHFNDEKEHYQSLSDSQSPPTLFITCSDSRLVPNQTLPSKAGELFVIRNAGNLVPKLQENDTTNESLTLEYAVSVLKVKEIVVCGHVKCGAMGGILNLKSLEKFKEIHGQLNKCSHEFDQDWLNGLRDESDQETALQKLIEENVKQQMRNILSYPFVMEAIKNEGLILEGWVYDFINGKLVSQVSTNDL